MYSHAIAFWSPLHKDAVAASKVVHARDKEKELTTESDMGSAEHGNKLWETYFLGTVDELRNLFQQEFTPAYLDEYLGDDDFNAETDLDPR